MFLWILPLIIIGGYLYYKAKNSTRARVDKTFHGPPVYPIIGNSLDFVGKNSEEITRQIMAYTRQYKRHCRFLIGPDTFVALYDHRDVEVILGSNSQIDKSDVYRFTIPWIGYGLLTSTGPKWKLHRRLLTPTFHFKILEDFLDVFNKNGAILCDRLANNSKKGTFNVYPYVNLAALDNICETAMGLEIDAQRNSESSYVRAIKDLCQIINMRAYKAWLAVDIIFNLTKYGAMHKKALALIHGTTEKIIKQKKKELEERRAQANKKLTQDDDGINQKRRLAFLDLLLESDQLSDQDIREEVDTFMFEGHDTVSSGISFLIYALSNNPDVQEKCLEEQRKIFGDDSERAPTYKEIQEMKYLEIVIKEAQRIYPSVSIIGRRLSEDVKLSDGKIIPKNTQVAILIHALHRNTEVFKDPEVFNPDNFSPEAVQKRHPYAYVPFSAGPRNCIGQKFAMIEMKATASKIIRRFKLLPCDKNDEPRLTAELVLVSPNGINIRLENRIT